MRVEMEKVFFSSRMLRKLCHFRPYHSQTTLYCFNLNLLQAVKSRRRPLSFDRTYIPTTPQKLPPLLFCFLADRVTCKSIINNARWRCQFIHRFFRREEDFVGKFFSSLFSVAETIRGGPENYFLTLRIFLSICLS